MSRRGGKRAVAPEVHNDERWMASYMDMVTVLMCMFIVLFAMSSVDAAKFEQLKNSLATGFGQVDEGKVDTAEGIVVPADQVGDEGELTDTEAAVIEIENLTALKEQINAGLTAQGLQNAVSYTIDQRGLTVALVENGAYFAANSATLTPAAVPVLEVISHVLTTTPNFISVEGHTDGRAPEAPYATNWELSSDRATKVVRHFVEHGGIAAARIGAVGYSSARPKAPESSNENMAVNRRADVVVLSDKPEAVRALIPGLLENGVPEKTEKRPEKKHEKKEDTGGHH